MPVFTVGEAGTVMLEHFCGLQQGRLKCQHETILSLARFLLDVCSNASVNDPCVLLGNVGTRTWRSKHVYERPPYTDYDKLMNRGKLHDSGVTCSTGSWSFAAAHALVGSNINATGAVDPRSEATKCAHALLKVFPRRFNGNAT